MANRADAAESPDVTGFGKVNQPLTRRGGVSIRYETADLGNVEIGARKWGQVTDRWREWYDDRRDAGLVYENDEGDQLTGPQENRFDPSYSGRQYAKLKDLERGLHDEYGDRFHTAMLTLTASSTDDVGQPRPPLDHLQDLDSSWESVRRALHRELEDCRWEYLAVLEPHKSGYPHIHIAVFVDGVVRERQFQSVIDAHLRNCPTAERDAHEYDNVITVKKVAGDRNRDIGEIGNLGSYLGEYLGLYDGDPTEAPEHIQRFNALLWASGKQRWRPSNGAQEFMSYDPPEEISEWELIGVTYDGGETVEPVNPDGGGVDWVETQDDRPPPV